MGLIKDKIDKQRYITQALEVEKKYGIPTNLLVGLLKAESDLDPNDVSPAGAIGVAQFMKNTAKEYGIDPKNPEQSIEAAGKYLANSYKQFGNWDDTLRSYNFGVKGVQDWKAGKRGLPKETQDYVGRVYSKANISYKDNVKPFITTNVINFEMPKQSGNFEGVPDVYQEPKEEVKQAQEELTQQQNEKNFLTELYKQQIEEAPQEVQQEAPTQFQQTNLLDTFNQVTQFIDTPLIAQEGRIIEDKRGQWKFPGEITKINSPNITMKNVNYKVLGVADTGEQKMMYPNQDYVFNGAESVTEYPQLTDKEKAFLKAIQQYKNKV